MSNIGIRFDLSTDLSRDIILRLYRDSTVLTITRYTFINADLSENAIPGLSRLVDPGGAGTYVFKLTVQSSGTLTLITTPATNPGTLMGIELS